MSGVDLFLAARQASVAAGVGIKAPPPLRDPDRRATALVDRVGDAWTPAEARALLHALRHVTEKETDAIAALDRFLLRCADLGLDPAPMAGMRTGRVELAESLGLALADAERAELLLRHT